MVKSGGWRIIITQGKSVSEMKLISIKEEALRLGEMVGEPLILPDQEEKLRLYRVGSLVSDVGLNGTDTKKLI